MTAHAYPVRDLILAIDDDPYRYMEMSGGSSGLVVIVTEDPDDIERILTNYEDRILGVCLDYDLDLYPRRGLLGTETGWDAAQEHIIHRRHPVAVVSANPEGNQRICNLLAENGRPYVYAPANVSSDVAGRLSAPWWRIAVAFFEEHWQT